MVLLIKRFINWQKLVSHLNTKISSIFRQHLLWEYCILLLVVKCVFIRLRRRLKNIEFILHIILLNVVFESLKATL
jgi:hypothetical protein